MRCVPEREDAHSGHVIVAQDRWRDGRRGVPARRDGENRIAGVKAGGGCPRDVVKESGS